MQCEGYPTCIFSLGAAWRPRRQSLPPSSEWRLLCCRRRRLMVGTLPRKGQRRSLHRSYSISHYHERLGFEGRAEVPYSSTMF
jgi:hypothetical protein